MKKIQLTFIFVLFQYILFSQTGQSFINNYPPYKFSEEGQIWSIIQDNRGVMYFGGNAEVHEFDGVSWRKIGLTDGKQAIRSMAADSSGRIYVGAVGEVGYLEPDKKGKMHYISIVEEIDSAHRNFTDVWTMQTQGDNLYFCTDKYLFRYNPNSNPKVITFDDSINFFLLSKVRDEIFISTLRNGIFKIDGDSLVSLPRSKDVYPLILLPYEDDKYLVVNEQLWVYDPNNKDTSMILTKKYFDQNQIHKTEEILSKSQIYISGVYLANNKYAIGTIKNGIIIIDKNAKILNIINKNQKLISNTIQYLFLDNQKQLWAATSFGISNVELNSAIEYFDDKNGIEGSIYSVFRKDNVLYVSTNFGLYYLKGNKFIGLSDISGKNALQVFPPYNFKISDTNITLTFLPTTFGLLKLFDKKVKLVNKFYPNSVLQSKFDSNKVYMSAGYSLYVASLKDELSNPVLINEFDFIPTVVGEYNEDNLWIINESKLELYNIKTKKIKKFEDNLEIEGIKFYDAKYLFNDLVFFTNKGFFVFDIKNKKFQRKLNSVFELFNDYEITYFKTITENLNFALYQYKGIKHLSLIKNNNGEYENDTIPFKRILNYDDFYIDGDSIVWIISPNCLYKFDINFERSYDIKNSVIFRRITASDSLIFEGTFYKTVNGKIKVSTKQNENFEFVIDFKHNNLRFDYALPEYESPQEIQYCYMLSGRKKIEWSGWTSNTFKELSNLPKGKYVFKVKARNVYGMESKVAEIKFKILPPWYQTLVAYFIYILLLIGLILAIVKINSIRLKKENEHLDNLVKLRTAEINQQNEEIRTQSEHLKEMNSLLVEKNDEVKQQNIEIKAIADRLEQVNAKIREKNEYITDSINYAKRIQEAILPSKDLLSALVPEHFIFYQPKDIISGDFYWVKRIKSHLLISVADCTGHGVPGGLIAMLGISILNETVRHKKINSPAKAFEFMRKTMKYILKQKHNVESLDETMDMGLIDINMETKEIIFSGANIPLWIFRKNDIILLKPVFNPIGIYPFEKPFINEKIKLQDNDMIYLATDGYIDQLNNRTKKYSSKRLKEFFYNIYTLPVDQQKQKLIENFMLWSQGKQQTDDILILGFRWLENYY